MSRLRVNALSISAVSALENTASLICKSRRTGTEFIDALRCLGLGQRLIEFLAGVSTQRLEIRALRVGHRFVSGFPLFRIALQSRLCGIVH